MVSLAISGLVLGACSSTSSSPASTTTTVAGPAAGSFTRTILAESQPATAPGQTLYLQRVAFGPHTQLALHHHEGLQESTILSGDLTYTVVQGSAGLRRASGTSGTIEAGTTVVLHPGDSLVEYASTIHKGANDTDRVVELIISALLTTGAPLSTPN